MKRTTILLPDDLAALVEHERRRRGLSTAAIVREAVAAHLSTVPAPRRLRIASLGRSGRSDGAARAEEILAEDWGSAAFIEGHLGRQDAPPSRPSSAADPGSTMREAGDLGVTAGAAAAAAPESIPQRRRAGGR